MDWIEQGISRNLVKLSAERRDDTLKQGSFFPSLNQIAGLNDLDLVASLEKIVKPFNMKDTIQIGKPDSDACSVTSVFKNVDKLRSSTSCERLCAENFLQNSPGVSAQTVTECVTQPLLSKHVLLSNSVNVKSEYMTQDSKDSDSEEGKKRDGPSPAQLDDVKNYYIEQIPDFHRVGEDFKKGLHHVDIVFENHFSKKPKTVRGLGKYAFALLKYRMLMSIRSPSGYYGFDIQTITTHQTDGCVRIHWRYYYTSNWKFIKAMFNFEVFNPEKKMKNMDSFDGISTIYVNKNGQVIKHHVDRKTPIDSAELNPAAKNIAVKLASIKGLATNESNTYNHPQVNMANVIPKSAQKTTFQL